MIAIAGALAVAVVAGGMALASIPDASGTIHGCYGKSNGNLRVIDPASEQCKTNETSLDWNQSGPPGAPAANGGDTVAPGGKTLQPCSENDVASIPLTLSSPAKIYVSGAGSWGASLASDQSALVLFARLHNASDAPLTKVSPNQSVNADDGSPFVETTGFLLEGGSGPAAMVPAGSYILHLIARTLPAGNTCAGVTLLRTPSLTYMLAT